LPFSVFQDSAQASSPADLPALVSEAGDDSLRHWKGAHPVHLIMSLVPDTLKSNFPSPLDKHHGHDSCNCPCTVESSPTKTTARWARLNTANCLPWWADRQLSLKWTRCILSYYC